MNTIQNRRLRRFALVLLGLAAVTAGAAADDDASPAVQGRFLKYSGLRVLEVWGGPADTGYAHGYLLADDVLKLFDEYLLGVLVEDPATYEHALLPMMRKTFVWPEYAEEELAAMLRGVKQRLGRSRPFAGARP